MVIKDKKKSSLKPNIIAFVIALVLFILLRNSILQIVDIDNMSQEFMMGVDVGSSMIVLMVTNGIMLYNFVVIICTLAYRKFKKNIFEPNSKPGDKK